MTVHIDAQYFREQLMGKAPAHLRGVTQPILSSWDDVDELLYACEINAGYVKLIGERPLGEAEFAERIPYYGQTKTCLNRERLYNELANGATLVLNRLEMRSLRIKRLCNAIAHLSLGQVVANGYLAMTGDSAFGNHWDAHDVFATQLIGRKRWKIYKPTFANPIAGQLSRDRREECPTEAVLDVITEPGDILYIPRGWWHCAYPSEGECFHLAIGVHKPYVLDYLGWLSASVLNQHEACRDSLSLGQALPLDASMAQEMARLAQDESTLNAFERMVFYKERMDGGLNLGAWFARDLQALEARQVRLATPYSDLVQRDNLALNGLRLQDNLLTRQLIDGPCALADLRARLTQLDDDTFLQTIKELMAKGVVHLY
ncbi:cupin domain-containing protein [Pseudomonas entomophila]|uniref:cupin domain-containing protein n=1 Tax=Pseudomonas entomophila TaxID=312306 RepID=UPI001F00887E|nr:cupin domain-containing protein [Pseudomonas entomophila]MCG8292073.1 cupin domain-containing protein [Pseudomonas entomophila]